MTNSTSQNNKRHLELALPLVIAVTGHRDLVVDEVDPIRARVRSFLLELRERYPENRLTIMSPLAEGADMLVAEVAVELEIDLVVPLPKPAPDYLLDFTHAESRQRFESLCEYAIDVFTLATPEYPPAPEGVTTADWERDYCYAQLGAFLSAHCHVLLAIWDGKQSHHLGGTSQVVKFHHDDVMPGYTPKTSSTQKMLVDDESDLVYHIVCSRNRKNPDPHTDHAALDWSWYTKDEKHPRSKELPAQHKLIFERSREFSAEALRFADSIDAEKYSLYTQSDEEKLPAGVDSINRLYGIADWLAIHYQRITLRTLRITHIMAFLMGLMFILYLDVDSSRNYLFAFLVFIGLAYCAQLLAKRGSWQRKYLDYRTLAEGLRVQFYWAAAGVTSENKWKFAHDSYLQSQNPEFGWIRNVMRVAGSRCDANPNDKTIGVDFAMQEWVGGTDHGQLGYFKYKANERINRNRVTEKIARLSLVISVVTVFVFLFAESLLSESAHITFTVIMGTSLLLYGIREGYASATATKELIKQYEFMLRIFDNAHRRLTETEDTDERRQILAALGQSALDEHSDWILMHRERSLDESEIWRIGG